MLVDLHGRLLTGLCGGKECLGLLEDGATVALESEHVVGLLLHDLGGVALGAPVGVEGENAAGHVEHLQQLTSACNLAWCPRDLELPKQQLRLRGEGVKQVQRRGRMLGIACAATRLAIEGDDLPGQVEREAREPARPPLGEHLGRESPHHTRERVCARGPLGQREKSLEPGLLGFDEGGDLVPVLAVTEHRAEGHEKQVHQKVAAGASHARIGDVAP
jgi:hypothetical protein